MRIIPALRSVNYYDGEFIFNKNTTIDCPYDNIMSNINGFLQKTVGFALKKGSDITFAIDEKLTFDEGYFIKIDNTVIVTAKTEKGLFYGAQTLKQMIYSTYSREKKFAKWNKAVIEDRPRFPYRGFMFDCARHFFDVNTVKSYIDAISMLKMNVFHWHLTEDQGWRVQIDAYPKLLEVGSRRAGTMRDKKPYGGYFTKDDIREVVEYAKERYIDVVPEFDMPGHTRAVIASYPELSCKGQAVEVATKFGIHKEILCGGNDKTYDFISTVLDEFSGLFPADYIHLGGDEAVKTEWYSCEKCQNKIKELGLKNEEQLQGYMTNYAVEHSKQNGKTVICWNESANSNMLDDSVVLEYWRDGKDKANIVREVSKGRRLIVASFNPYYLDYPYAMFSLKSAYNFEPAFSEIKNYEKNILGVESPIWTEYVDNNDILSFRVFPRLSAVAESGWALAKNKDYKSFECALRYVNAAIEAQTGIKAAPIKKCNPGALAKPIIMIKFLKNLVDFDVISRGMKAEKEMRKMRTLNQGDKE